jgi:hypothetical protein
MVDVGGQGSPQQAYFGTEYRARDLASFVIPIELLAAAFFAAIALVFVGVGQLMGRAFRSANDRVAGYLANVAGSLAGTIAFAAASYFRTPPLVWFAIFGAAWLLMLPRRSAWQMASLAAVLGVMGLLDGSATWSPYYKLEYYPATRSIVTNNILYQSMTSRDADWSAYQLPHWLNRDSGGSPFKQVLIIGAGTGNDVAAALLNGAERVDAVEIDPAIQAIGRALHPQRPYQDPRVTSYIDDGRNFLRRTTRKYDPIVFALVDSLALHSGYSSIRLESFLFTQEAFDDVAAHLAPGGVWRRARDDVDAIHRPHRPR